MRYRQREKVIWLGLSYFLQRTMYNFRLAVPDAFSGLLWSFTLIVRLLHLTSFLTSFVHTLVFFWSHTSKWEILIISFQGHFKYLCCPHCTWLTLINWLNSKVSCSAIIHWFIMGLFKHPGKLILRFIIVKPCRYYCTLWLQMAHSKHNCEVL